MAKSRFLCDASHADARPLLSLSPRSISCGVVACAACAFFAAPTLPAWADASTPHARAVEISTPESTLGELPPAPVRDEDKIDDAASRTASHAPTQRPAAKESSSIKPVAGRGTELHPSALQATTLKTSAPSRMVMRRAGALRHMAAERSENTPASAARFALTPPDNSIALPTSASTPAAPDAAANDPSNARAPRLAATSPQSIGEQTRQQDATPTRVEMASSTSTDGSTTPDTGTVTIGSTPAEASTPAAADSPTRVARADDDVEVPVTGTVTPAKSNSEAAPGSFASAAPPSTPADSAPASVFLSSTEDANMAAIEEFPDGPVAATIVPPAPKTSKKDKNAKAPATPQPPARLFAAHISYDGNTIIATGDPQNPVHLDGTQTRITADEVRLNTVTKVVTAQGRVRVDRKVTSSTFHAFGPSGIRGIKQTENVQTTETLVGENFEYNFDTQQGHLDKVRVRLENFNIVAQSLIISGNITTAYNVRVWPGGLTAEDFRRYGTPPFSLRLKSVVIDRTKAGLPATQSSDTHQTEAANNVPTYGPRVEGRSGYLYFRNLRLVPVPAYFLRRSGAPQAQQTYQLTPRIFFNPTDGVLLTARLQFPLSKMPAPGTKKSKDETVLNADVGISTKVGFRGGLELDSNSRLGSLSLSARINDVVSSQLTNRIELDRLPEIEYRPPGLPLFKLPGTRTAGLRFSFLAGDYREDFINTSHTVSSSKLQAQVTLTSRLTRADGPYIDLFARGAKYSLNSDSLGVLGMEVGYTGHLGPRLLGNVAFIGQNVHGFTPFRFDRVEIARELRTTFDFLLTPRYIIPIDLRYDLDRRQLRDESFGLLRNYKTFAYGLIYDTARSQLSLEIRQGF